MSNKEHELGFLAQPLNQDSLDEIDGEVCDYIADIGDIGENDAFVMVNVVIITAKEYDPWRCLRSPSQKILWLRWRWTWWMNTTLWQMPHSTWRKAITSLVTQTWRHKMTPTWRGGWLSWHGPSINIVSDCLSCFIPQERGDDDNEDEKDDDDVEALRVYWNHVVLHIQFR